LDLTKKLHLGFRNHASVRGEEREKEREERRAEL
jgi:hypothetical protein